MAWAVVAIAGASALGAYVSSQAAQNAAHTQADAANNATALQGQQFNTQWNAQAPYRQAGVNALGDINNNMASWNKPFTMSDFQQSPGYQFALQQGQQALARSEAEKGLGNSGGAQKVLSAYTVGMANQEYQNAFNNYQTQNMNAYNRLAGVSGLGQAATANSNAASQNYANQAGSNMIGAGNAIASGQVGSANAITSSAQNGLNNWMTMSMLNKYNPSGGGGGGGSGSTGTSTDFQPDTTGWLGSNTYTF